MADLSTNNLDNHLHPPPETLHLVSAGHPFGLCALFCFFSFIGSSALKVSVLSSTYYLFFFFLLFLGPHLWHMEVPRLRVKSELQLLVTVITTQDSSYFCNLHHNSQQHQILNRIFMDISWVCNLLSHNGNSYNIF